MSIETDVAVIRAALDNCTCAQGVHADTTVFAALYDLHNEVKRVLDEEAALEARTREEVKKLRAVITALDAYLEVQFGTDEERQDAWENVLNAYDGVGG